jgi:aspartate aminotransferase
VRVHPPEGAFYLFPDFTPLAAELEQRGVEGSESLQQLLLDETGVAVLPGVAFGRPEKELTVRLAYVDFDGAGALAASETHPLDAPLPENFTDRYCLKVIEAVRRIAKWVRG